ncbi:MAG: hypothetical protein JWQ40_1958 [Segetibacter sp.]|nr:hypothetical protein [Segetibacter sp.]
MAVKNKFLGIEIGGTKLQLSLGNSSNSIGQNLRYTIDPAAGASHIQEQIRDGLNKLESFDDIAAIGVGFGGPVDWKTGSIRVSHQVTGWEDFNLLEWLKQLTKKPVAIDNDANVAALGEAIHGCGKGSESVFYITMGSGIGGGMILNGEIYHGKAPGEVEVGHLLLDKKGNTLESKCSGWAVNQKINTFISENPGSMLANMAAGTTKPLATFLQPAIENGDEAAKKITEEIADDLAFGLSHVVHLFHPDMIIIGGGLSLLKAHLQIPVSEKLPQYIMKAFLPAPPVRIAALGETVVPVGAIELAKKHWLSLQSKHSF